MNEVDRQLDILCSAIRKKLDIGLKIGQVWKYSPLNSTPPSYFKIDTIDCCPDIRISGMAGRNLNKLTCSVVYTPVHLFGNPLWEIYTEDLS